MYIWKGHCQSLICYQKPPFRISFRAYNNFSTDFSDLNNLGDQITRNVHQQLAPLQNLGARITADVNRQLEPLRSREYINNAYSRVYPQPVVYQQPFIPPPQPFLGPNLNLPQLDNLGQMIQQSVNEGLEPVRAMEITAKMKNGVGGTTIATHLPAGTPPYEILFEFSIQALQFSFGICRLIVTYTEVI